MTKNGHTKNGHRRFQLKERRMSAGHLSDEVAKVQRYLSRFGYLTESFEHKRLDAATQDALRRFQTFMTIQPTGEVDPETAAALEKPRCGVPDVVPWTGDGSASFGLSGCSYANIRTMRFDLIQGTPDIPGNLELSAIRNAFFTWEPHVPINFFEGPPANFRIGWFEGDHGDGSPFDGVGNVLAHAFFPPPCGGVHAGRFDFDDAELWDLTGAGWSIDTETVALHEIGHLLGLAHSSVAGAVMFPLYLGPRRVLSPDDIAGIRAAYNGGRGTTFDGVVHLEDIGDVNFRNNQFAGTRGQSRRLEGFQMRINPQLPNLSMRYMAHVEGMGDVFANEGEFVGTRNLGKRLEGFSVELIGPLAPQFNVIYMAHIEDIGDTALFRNGQFCGTRGQARRVEGMLVRIERK